MADQKNQQSVASDVSTPILPDLLAVPLFYQEITDPEQVDALVNGAPQRIVYVANIRGIDFGGTKIDQADYEGYKKFYESLQDTAIKNKAYAIVGDVHYLMLETESRFIVVNYDPGADEGARRIMSAWKKSDLENYDLDLTHFTKAYCDAFLGDSKTMLLPLTKIGGLRMALPDQA